MSHRKRHWVTWTMLFMSALACDGAAEQATDSGCRLESKPAQLVELPEASGLALGRRTQGRLWAHNDGEPLLFALDASGRVVGRIRLSGITVQDWEAIAVGRCPQGSCLYIADIGDNTSQRKQITVYRVAEPIGTEDSVTITERFHGVYPDGPHDAETLLIAADATIHIVTKGERGPVALYRFPRALQSGAAHSLERVGSARGTGRPRPDERVTDGAVSIDGNWVVLRTRQRLTFHRAADLMSGNWREVHVVDLTPLGETQGEGVALGSVDDVYVASEGGAKSRPGTFGHLRCNIDR